jgi:hypothetical protein
MYLANASGQWTEVLAYRRALLQIAANLRADPAMLMPINDFSAGLQRHADAAGVALRRPRSVDRHNVRKSNPRTGREYSDGFSPELARNWSALLHGRRSISPTSDAIMPPKTRPCAISPLWRGKQDEHFFGRMLVGSDRRGGEGRFPSL